MRRVSRRSVCALAASLALLAGCGDATPAGPPSQAVADAPAASPASRAAPVGDDATVALAVDKLLAEWKDPPEGRSREDVVADLAALGVSGFEHLLQALGPEDEFARGLHLQDLIERLGTPSLDVTARAIASPGRLRAVGLLALGHSNGLHWPFDERGPAIARALLTALEEPDLDTRRSVLARLGETGPTGVPVAERVATRVLATDADERGDAFDALRNLGPAASPAVPALLVALRRSSDSDFRENIADVLGETHGADPDARAATLALLDDDRADVRQFGAVVVARWRGQGSVVVPRLVALLRDPEPLIHDVALEGLLSMAQDPAAAKLVAAAIPELPPYPAAELIAYAFHDDGPGLATVAPRLLATPDSSLRTATLRALNARPDVVIDPLLIRPLLDDADEAVRVQAAGLLLRVDPTSRDRALATASNGLSSSDASIRTAAATAVAAHSDPSAPPAALLALLADPDEYVRRAVANGLPQSTSSLGVAPPGALAALIDDVLESRLHASATALAVRFEGGADALVAAALKAVEGGETGDVRVALGALAAAGTCVRSSVPTLVAELIARRNDEIGLSDDLAYAVGAMTDNPYGIAKRFDGEPEGARRLLAFGDDGADALVHWSALAVPWARAKLCAGLAADETLARAVVRAAATRGDDEGDVFARTGAAGLAPVLGPRRAVELLVELAADPCFVVRRAVATTLSALGAAGANLTPATDALRVLLGDEDDGIRLETISAARLLPGLRQDIHRRLADEAPEVRLQAAATLLVDEPDEAARSALLEALSHAKECASLANADWHLVDSALVRIELRPSDAPVLANALLAIDDCSCQGPILRALARLGAAASPALVGVRLALDGDLPCRWGIHDEATLRADAIAALAAMGPAARAAIPDLTGVAARGPKFAAQARAAIAAITGSGR